jgi:hypothetical protein
LNYTRQDTLRQQQQMLRQQLHVLQWYQDGQPNKDNMPALLEAAGVPVTYWGAAVKDIKSAQWSLGIDQWEEKYRNGNKSQPNLYFLGDRTKGKSYASAAVLRKMALRKKVVGWRNWGKMVQSHYDRIRLANLKGEEYADAIFSEAEERWLLQDVIQILVIDDVDLGGTQDFILDDMYALLKYRTDNSLRTVMNGRLVSGQPTVAAKRFVEYRDETSLILR